MASSGNSLPATAESPGTQLVSCTLGEFLLYFLRLGTFGFGGPIALAGYMQRDLVEDRRWISKQDYLEVLALSLLYVRYGGLAWMQSAFYGIGAAVIAIIARSAVKLVKMTVQKDKLLWAIFAVMMAVTAITASEIVWLFLLCGALTILVRAPPSFRARSAI